MRIIKISGIYYYYYTSTILPSVYGLVSTDDINGQFLKDCRVGRPKTEDAVDAKGTIREALWGASLRSVDAAVRGEEVV